MAYPTSLAYLRFRAVVIMLLALSGIGGCANSQVSTPTSGNEYAPDQRPTAHTATNGVPSNSNYAYGTEKHYVAFSLKTAEQLVQKANKEHTDFRKDRALFGLGGMNKPKALFYDSQSQDWILLGERTADSGDLTLDDVAVALRTRFENPSIDPGVTIEPIVPGEDNAGDNPQKWDVAKRQQVKFFGPLKDTQFGLTCYQADWLMKRMVLGLEKLPDVPVPSFFDSARSGNGSLGSTKIVGRMWLCPVLNEVPILDGQKAVFIQETKIIVKTQTLFAERNGHIVQDAAEIDALDSASKRFASSFTNNYDTIARDRPFLERLRGLARLAGLAKGVIVGKWADDFSYFLHDYQVDSVQTPSDLDILHNEDQSLGETVVGGVELRNLAIRLRNGDITALTEAVIKMRPNPQSISWDFLFGDTFLPLPSNMVPGIDGKSDLVKGAPDEILWLRKAADDGDTDAMLVIAEEYLDGNVNLQKDAAEAVRWYGKAAEAGNAIGMFDLGVVYNRGRGVAKDYAVAVDWYRKAAAAGDAGGMNNLGTMYESGQGVTKDEALAANWYRKAADAGSGDAMNNLGFLYTRGLGLPHDDAEALKWYRKAVETGSREGMSNLGVMYQKGLIVQRDDVEAFAWFRKSAALGSPAGMDNLGSAYMNGEGVAIDVDAAFEWFRKAADAGSADGMNDLGKMYVTGKGVIEDATEAARWWQRAADAGNADAMFNLGVSYALGNGVAKDENEAIKLFRDAARLGNPKAQAELRDSNLSW